MRLFKLFQRASLALLLLAVALPAQAATISREEILSLVRQQVVQRQQINRNDVQVDWDDLSMDALLPSLPDGTVSLQIPQEARLVGHTSVAIQIYVNGAKFRTIFPRLFIKVLQKVLVANTTIMPGQEIAKGDVGQKRMALETMYGQVPLTNMASLDGAQATRQIQPGTVLTSSMFRIPPLITMGSQVAVMVHSGDLTVITTGEAKSNGALGETIRVMNPDTKREYTARVVGPNRVELKMEE